MIFPFGDFFEFSPFLCVSFENFVFKTIILHKLYESLRIRYVAI